MKILFVHQNFPGQFPHLAPALAQRGHDVVALTAETNMRQSPVRVVKYRTPAEVTLSSPLTNMYAKSSERGLKAARAARQMRDTHGYHPDVIFGHSGWGETLYLKEVWPQAKLLVYAELMYQTAGLDTDFDPEFRRKNPLDTRISTTARAAHLIQSMVQADAALSPTAFQASTFQPEFQPKITICHDGVDTNVVCPNPNAQFTVPNGPTFHTGDEVLTFVNRSLEPYRGYHIFMRALPQVLKSRPNAHVLIVGDEGQSYGAAPPGDKSWKQIFLEEVQQDLDLSRVHFLGRIPYTDYVSMLQVSRAHAYLTYPFVLSWSLMESMSAGCAVIASNTPPVQEVINHGQTGQLVDFFDINGWSQALSRALADPKSFQAMRGAARRKIVDTYDLKTICLPKLIEFVESAGNAAPTRPIHLAKNIPG
ncbi:glycosyl transferase family 1 [Thioclava sp. SK-1]|uniref:glycosyltransferase n=1 Tax=Thioclava sp. SK-1 TaxID=1889770 RepID=UPI0008249651|nr:glycosyltransferase [Thioclava sp. SK-1]OCX66671.1 glycosyl transferase family 1 [Thioclava sp. SK-1]